MPARCTLAKQAESLHESLKAREGDKVGASQAIATLLAARCDRRIELVDGQIVSDADTGGQPSAFHSSRL